MVGPEVDCLKKCDLIRKMWYLIISVIACYVKVCPALVDVNDTTVYESVPMTTYHTYENVWLFEYRVPQAAFLASWSFRGLKTDGCPNTQIHIYLQFGSYPVINPLNETFPAKFYLKRSNLHHLSVTTNESLLTFKQRNPLAGSWFAAAFLLKSDNQETVKKLTSKDCSFSLASNLTTITLKIQDLSVNYGYAVNNITVAQDYVYYRFFVNRLVWKYRLKITGCYDNLHNKQPCPIEIYVQNQALPDLYPRNDSLYVNCTSSGNKSCKLDVNQPITNEFSYIMLKKADGVDHLNFNLSIKTYECSTSFLPDVDKAQLETQCVAYRKLYRTSDILVDFAVTYALKATQMEFIENVVFVRDGFSRVFEFEVIPLIDSGGTLRFRALLNSFNSSRLVWDSPPDMRYNVTICLQRGRIPVHESLVNCHHLNRLVLSSDDPDQAEVIQYYPYPESGTWYLAMNAVCYNANGTVDCDREVKSTGVSVKFDLKLSACVDGICGEFGDCTEVRKGMYTFTTCSCLTGYRGYGCTDSTNANPGSEQLMYTLFLTLSNLFFLPGIFLALARRHFTEALVYFCNMFFSSFYHACDMGPWSLYTLCIMPYHVVSYCDFFCSIMSFWVTLICMAELPFPLYSLAHMMGAVALSMGVEWKQHGIIPYVVPISVGVIIVIVSWIYRLLRCRDSLSFTRRQLILILPGIILAGTGMSIFGFLETDDNYPITHSAWHACMSLSIICFLPRRRKDNTGICGEDSDSTVLELNDTSGADLGSRSHLAFKDDPDDDPLLDPLGSDPSIVQPTANGGLRNSSNRAGVRVYDHDDDLLL